MTAAKLRYLLILLVVQLVSLKGWRCDGCWEQERFALLQIKSLFMKYSDPCTLESWVKGNSDCCRWESVECNNITGRVTKLSLHTVVNWTSEYTWYLNASYLRAFEDLESLHLTGSHLAGFILSEDFGGKSSKLSKLMDLDLSTNSLNDTDNTFQFVSVLPALRILNLAWNQLTGSILYNGSEKASSRLSKLEVIDLSHNQIENFTRFIVMHNLSCLEDLILDRNRLEKSSLQSFGALFNSLKFLSLPMAISNSETLQLEGLCNLKKLEALDLSSNALEGQIPSCFRNMTSLQLLDLSDNLFTGALPHLTSLVYLQISSNNFQVPVSFNSLANSSKLKVILCDENELIPETSFPTFPPKFQLRVFTLWNCRHGGLHLTLPRFLYHQNDLRAIVISNANFRGNLPSWLLENNTKMEMIILRNNSFIGSFALSSDPCPHTRLIDLSNNKLQGHIPTNINLTFPNLEFLNLSSNVISGNIPDCLSYMTSLSLLDMSYNQLFGGLPKQVTSPLRYAKLSHNNLDGQIPSTIVNYSSYALYLDGNNFVGNFPDVTFNMNVSFRILDASHNKISGELPRWIGNVSDLVGIDLSNNLLEASIPVEFCQLDNLEFLYLSENNLFGSIPSCFSPPKLRHVHLYKNGIRGEMTRAFTGSFSLVTLDLSHNDLTGTIPSWLRNLSALSILLLTGNHFRGDISIHLCHMNKLSLLDLSHNQISGSIPSCLTTLTFEAQHDKSYSTSGGSDIQLSLGSGISDIFEKTSKYIWSMNHFDIDKYFYYHYRVPHTINFTTKKLHLTYGGISLEFMSGIDLSSNQFTGKIPEEIGNLSKIYALNLSHNNFTGSIPTTFSNLKQIESLDLSYNNLNGKIPPQLIELNTLEVFSVAYNNLSGATPERKYQFGTFDESSYIGNAYLCGPPLNKSCSETESPPQNPSDENKDNDDFIDMGVFYVSFSMVYIMVLLGIVIILYINPHWRQIWFYFIEACITICYIFFRNIFKK